VSQREDLGPTKKPTKAITMKKEGRILVIRNKNGRSENTDIEDIEIDQLQVNYPGQKPAEHDRETYVGAPSGTLHIDRTWATPIGGQDKIATEKRSGQCENGKDGGSPSCRLAITSEHLGLQRGGGKGERVCKFSMGAGRGKPWPQGTKKPQECATAARVAERKRKDDRADLGERSAKRKPFARKPFSIRVDGSRFERIGVRTGSHSVWDKETGEARG